MESTTIIFMFIFALGLFGSTFGQGSYYVWASGINQPRVNGPGYTRLIPVAAPAPPSSPRRMGTAATVAHLSRKDDNAEVAPLADTNHYASRAGPGYYEAAPSQDMQQSGSDPNDPDGDVIVGVAGRDYPVYDHLPQTGFDCSRYQYPGYYGDQEALCQVFHICQADGRRDSFLCPNGTIFNQQYFVCDWWYNVNCQQIHTFFDLNSLIGVAPVAAPAPLQQDYHNHYAPPPMAEQMSPPAVRYPPPALPQPSPQIMSPPYDSAEADYRRTATTPAPPSAAQQMTSTMRPPSGQPSYFSDLEFPQSVYSQLSSPPFS